MSVWLKRWVAGLGHDSAAVEVALTLKALSLGIRVSFEPERISLSRKKRRMYILRRHYIYIPLMMKTFDAWFDELVPMRADGMDILDFSKPGERIYRKDGLSLWSSSLPEEDSSEVYTRYYKPKQGDVIWDVGANCGLTTYQFSQAVGATGRVIAWEPDSKNREFLARNIKAHELANVIVDGSALAETDGAAVFDCDGSVGSGLPQFLAYSVSELKPRVATMSLPSAIAKYGVPTLLKMDIEGGELGVIRGAVQYFKQQHPPISFAMETHVLQDGSTTEPEVTRLLNDAGYSVTSGHDRMGQNFLWAN